VALVYSLQLYHRLPAHFKVHVTLYVAQQAEAVRYLTLSTIGIAVDLRYTLSKTQE